MLEAIRRAISFLRQKQILHKLGVVISVTVIGIACYVLYHMLRGIDTNEVIEAIKSTEPRQIVMAAIVRRRRLFHPDILRSVRDLRDRPRRRALPRQRAAPPSPAIRSATMSAPACSRAARCATGSIRRTASNAIDVAKICFLAGLTFWLGNAAVLGLGIAYHPEAAASDRPASGLAEPDCRADDSSPG